MSKALDLTLVTLKLLKLLHPNDHHLLVYTTYPIQSSYNCAHEVLALKLHLRSHLSLDYDRVALKFYHTSMRSEIGGQR